MKMYNPPHPGAVLREYLAETSVTEAAQRLGVTRAALSRILNSADMAVRLSILLGTSSKLWLGLQNSYDLWHAEQQPHDFVIPLNATVTA